MVDIHANLLSVMNDSDFLVILPNDVKYPLYACGASGLWEEKVQPKLPGYLEIARYYFRYWTKERLFPDPEYSVTIFRGTVDAVPNTQKSSVRAVWLVNDAVVKILANRYGTINTLFHKENIYDIRGKYEKNLLGFAEDNNIGFEFENGHYVARHINPIDASSLYPKVDTFILAGGRNYGKTELTKQLMESGTLRVEPFPGYKYDSAAYQNIAASREAMKRAEHGDHVMDALSYVWADAGKRLKELEREYILNDAKATRELIENMMKEEEENEIMKYNNTINTTIDGITINQELGESMSEVELSLRLHPLDAHHLKMAANNTIAKRGHRPKIHINLDDNCNGAIDFLPVNVKPKKVIFNNPATIVIWSDGTKTVVTRQKGDRYNKEEGLALCYMKKALGNSSRVFNDALHAGLEMGEK